MMVGTQAGKSRYLTLDGMRGVAALAVVAVHNPGLFGSVCAPEGFLAVDFFFVLSGFVVAEAYGRRLEQGLGWRQFMGLRLLRFYPLYLLGTALGVFSYVHFTLTHPTGVVTPAAFAASLALNLFFIPSWFVPTDIFPVLGPAWSLFFELLVNAGYGLFHRALKGPWLLGLIALSALSLGLVAGTLGTLNQGFKPNPLSAWMGLSRVLFSFCVGLLLQRMPRSRVRIPSFVLVAALMAALKLCPSGGNPPLFELIFVGLASPALVYLGSANEPSHAAEARLYEVLGAASYAVYVLHFPLGPLLVAPVHRLIRGPFETYAPWSGIALLALIFLISAWAGKRLDEPFRRWIGSKGLFKPSQS
jgi:peptidoglycan/LPS O-acetylase OafA/YrhL